jgi:hypothetical protein
LKNSYAKALELRQILMPMKVNTTLNRNKSSVIATRFAA